MHRFLLIFFAAALCAQERPVLELSLKQAVDLALAPDGNERMKLAREAIVTAETRKRQALAGLLPNVDASASLSNQTRNLRSIGIDFSVPGVGQIPSLVGPFTVADMRATGTLSVFDLSTIKRYQAGRAGVEQSRRELDDATDRTIERVARGYLAAVRAQATVDAYRANVNLAESLLKLAQSQKTAGTGTGIEVTRAQVQLANEQQRLAVAENELERTSLQLLKDLGVNIGASLKLTDPMAYQETQVEPAEQALSKARETRADLKAQAARENVAKLNYDSVKWERLPSLSVSGDYGAIGVTEGPILPTRVGAVTLRIPVFDGGRRDARRAEAASQLRSAQIETRELGRQTELELRLAIDGIRAAAVQVKSAQEGLALANNEVEQARRRYEAGVSTSVELTDAQTRLVRARDNYVAAVYSHNLARIDLTAAMGTISQTVR